MKITSILISTFLLNLSFTTTVVCSSEKDESSEGTTHLATLSMRDYPKKTSESVALPLILSGTMHIGGGITPSATGHILTLTGKETLISNNFLNATYLIDNNRGIRILTLSWSNLSINNFNPLSQSADSKKIQNNGVFQVSPYLKDGTYPAGTIEYTLWRTEEGITGNKPTLDRSVPHAEFMTLALSEDKKDLILTLTLAEELTI